MSQDLLGWIALVFYSRIAVLCFFYSSCISSTCNILFLLVAYLHKILLPMKVRSYWISYIIIVLVVINFGNILLDIISNCCCLVEIIWEMLLHCCCTLKPSPIIG